jgi:hypothetical protein
MIVGPFVGAASDAAGSYANCPRSKMDQPLVYILHCDRTTPQKPATQTALRFANPTNRPVVVSIER